MSDLDGLNHRDEAYTGPPPRHFMDPGNGWVTPVEKILIAIGVVCLVGVFAFMTWAYFEMNATQKQVEASQHQNAENRSVECQLLVALGQPLPHACLEDEVVQHYDPDAVAPPTRTAGLICEIGRRVGIPSKDLPTVCSEVDGDG